jgi:hypothetical protein
MDERIPDGDLPEGLSRPARRALQGAGLTSLARIADVTEADVLRLHGVGPTAIVRLRAALAERGLAFRAGGRRR